MFSTSCFKHQTAAIFFSLINLKARNYNIYICIALFIRSKRTSKLIKLGIRTRPTLTVTRFGKFVRRVPFSSGVMMK